MGEPAAEVLTTVWDVVVIGGGPAGLIAARDLAGRGHAVLVAEEHDVIGQPVHCTGIVGIDAFDELSLPRSAVRTHLRRARFHGPSGEPVRIEAEHLAAAVIDRAEFDGSLAAAASRAGAHLACGSRVDLVEVTDSHVAIQIRGAAPVRARACIVACGANYRFNRALGLGVPRVLVQSAQAEVPFPQADEIDVFLGQEYAPGGFGWLVPFSRGGEYLARVGLLCTDGAGERFRSLTRRIWSDWSLDAAAAPVPRLKALPLAPVERTYADRVLAVGDAAGIVKPTTGGGIYYSLLSGSLAAEVLDPALKADALHSRALANYERAWKRRLWRDIRAGLAFRRVAASLSDDAIRRLVEVARVDGIVPLLKRHGNFNWHRAAAVALLRHQPFRRAISSFWS